MYFLKITLKIGRNVLLTYFTKTTFKLMLTGLRGGNRGSWKVTRWPTGSTGTTPTSEDAELGSGEVVASAEDEEVGDGPTNTTPI
jgi:hypothetical protein